MTVDTNERSVVDPSHQLPAHGSESHRRKVWWIVIGIVLLLVLVLAVVLIWRHHENAKKVAPAPPKIKMCIRDSSYRPHTNTADCSKRAAGSRNQSAFSCYSCSHARKTHRPCLTAYSSMRNGRSTHLHAFAHDYDLDSLLRTIISSNSEPKKEIPFDR